MLTSAPIFADAGEPALAPELVIIGAEEDTRAAASELMVQAMALIGVNYKYGGAKPESGFDCSGFVSHVFKEAAGVVLPHSAYGMSLVGKRVSARDLQPGDLVFYNTLKRAFSHVGIYVGNNKFIHAPSRGKAVVIADMSDGYWATRFQGARRMPALEQSATPSAAQQDLPPAELSIVLY